MGGVQNALATAVEADGGSNVAAAATGSTTDMIDGDDLTRVPTDPDRDANGDDEVRTSPGVKPGEGTDGPEDFVAPGDGTWQGGKGAPVLVVGVPLPCLDENIDTARLLSVDGNVLGVPLKVVAAAVTAACFVALNCR